MLGRGTTHQVDVLGEFVFTPAFSLPVRLFLEAKFYATPCRLDVVRNAHGVIHDVNENFITTPGDSRSRPGRFRRFTRRVWRERAADQIPCGPIHPGSGHHQEVPVPGLRLSGIVTTADLSLEFGNLTGPYLRLGEIERRLRRCVERMCGTLEDLRDACGNTRADAADNLTVRQIMNVFEKPERWAALNWGVQQSVFVAELDEVRRIRNAVAHFRPSPLTKEQVERLQIFAGWMKDLVP